MKKILACASLFFAVATASAQGALEQNKVQINGGVGLSGFGVPVYLGLDYGVARDFTIGAEASYSSKKMSGGYFDDKYSFFGFGVNGNYHFDRLLKLPNEFNLYAGATLGYYNVSNSKTYTGPTGLESYYENLHTSFAVSGFDLGLQIGGRYFFTKNRGLNLQFGGGINTFGGRIGLTYKL